MLNHTGKSGRRCSRSGGWIVLGSMLVSSGCANLSARLPRMASVQAARELVQQGQQAEASGETEKAWELYERAMRTCPSDMLARQHLAEEMWRRGQRHRALSLLEETVPLAAESPEFAIRAAQMSLEMGQFERGRRIVENGMHLHPHSAGLWALHGRCLLASQRIEEARSDFHRALSYEPQNAALMEELARLYRLEGRPNRALTTLMSLEELYPPSEMPSQLLFEKGLVLRDLSRHEDALVCLRDACRSGTANPGMLAELARYEREISAQVARRPVR